MRVEGDFDMPLARAALFERLLDPRLMAQCIPGCEQLEQLDAARYRAAVAIGLAGITARFNLVVELTGNEPPARIVCITRGEEGGRASQFSADSEILLHELALDATRVAYVSEVNLSGRLGRFALGVMKKKAQSMGDDFARNLRAALTANDAGVTRHG